MKNILLVSLMLFLAFGLFLGCVGDPEPAKDEPVEDEPVVKDEPVVEEPAKLEEWVIIDHKTKDFGGQVPDWATMTAIDLESTDKYKAFYVFIIDHLGKDLDGIELWARGFSAPSEISRMVSTRVKDKFVGAAVGDMDMLETYMEEVVMSVSEADFSGVRTEDKFWIKKQNKNKTSDIEFRYLFLVTVPQTEIDLAIERAFGDSQSKPKTEEEETARDRVKDAFDAGL